ncbi:MAG: hypothetical protein HS129_04965 [Leptospiraceae bacterium]|nr:hypothetical protein [Leptospiraceae bacterium]
MRYKNKIFTTLGIISAVLFFAGLLLGNGSLMIMAIAPTFGNLEDVREFAKSFNANTSGVTDLTALQNGQALSMHNLDETMVLLAQDSDEYNFLNSMFNKDTKSTLNVYGQILDWGGNGDFSFVGESDDAEFKDVIIKRIAKSVSFLAEGYAISKVLNVSDTGNYDPEAIQIQGAINRIMRSLAYGTWYGNKSINPLEFDGFVTELVSNGQVYDAGGSFPAISSLKELVVNIRTKFGLANELWLHDGVKNVLDAYYIGAKEFVMNVANPSLGYNIPNLIGAPLKDGKLEFKTDLWMNRHMVELPSYMDANNVKQPGKTNPNAPDAPTLTATVTGGTISGSKWRDKDCKDTNGADAVVSYIVVACNKSGRSAQSTTVITAGVMSKGKAINLVITPAGTGTAATYFQIFRESYPGSGKFYLTERILKSATPTTAYQDLNEWVPGCTEAVVGDFNSRSAVDQKRTYHMLRLLPMLQTKFTPNAVYQRKLAGMVEWYGGLAVLQPLRFYLIKNLPTTLS